jgi:hypothetical protein
MCSVGYILGDFFTNSSGHRDNKPAKNALHVHWMKHAGPNRMCLIQKSYKASENLTSRLKIYGLRRIGPLQFGLDTFYNASRVEQTAPR